MKIGLISLNENAADPPLGLAYISSYLKKYSHFKDIIIIDKEDFLKAIKKHKFDIIGISAMTTEFKKANELAKEIKKITDVPLVIGGVHISIMPQHLLESNFDIGCIGEGEITFLELCQELEKKKLDSATLKKINGLVFKDGNKIIITNKRELIKDLNIIPFPDRENLKMKGIYLLPQIKAGLDNIGIFTTMFTSRGCPYQCRFCSSAAFWERRIRFHSAEYVIEEIEMLVNKFKVEGIHILDDLFIVDKKRVKTIADYIEKKGLNKKVKFSLLLRTDLVTEDLLLDLKRMNVTHIGFGFESGSEKMLKYLKNNTLTTKNHNLAIELCKKYGFKVSGSFLLGNPYETKEDMIETLNFIKNNQLDQINVNQLIPMPNTEIWEYAKKQNQVNDSFEFTINNLSNLFVNEYNQNMILTHEVETEEFKRIFDQAQEIVKNKKLKNFSIRLKHLKYLKNPRVILKILKRRSKILSMLGFKEGKI